MNEQNVDLVKQAYAAFGRGDIDSILATVSDDIVWEPVVGAGPHVPQAGRRMGKAAVREFFDILANTLDFQTFEPREFIAQGDRVVVLGHYVATPRATGRRLESDWVMIFRVQNGLTTEFREFADSAAVNAAYEPRAAAAGR